MLARRIVLAARRPVGRPRGSRDLHGRARRVTRAEQIAYAVVIGSRIRDLRLERGIAPSELSAATGIHQSTLLGIENGRSRRDRNDPTNIKLQTLIRIARALDVRPSELLP